MNIIKSSKAMLYYKRDENNHLIGFRHNYKHYYYEETKLYYLNFRYYNPLFGRFINADAFVITGQGYTGNNSTSRVDIEGLFWFQIAGAAVGAFTESAINNLIDGTDNFGKTVLLDTAVNGTINYFTGKVANKVIKINSGWFKPKKIKTSFTGNYIKKIAKNTGLQAIMNVGATAPTSVPNVEASNSHSSLPSKPSNDIATSRPSSGEGLGGGFSIVGGVIGGFGGGSGGGRF